MKGYALASQDIRERIKKNIIRNAGSDYEKRIQPASFEPRIGNVIWEINTEHGRHLMPAANRKVEELLADLPQEQATQHSLLGGYELKRGHTYLVPLEEILILKPEEIVVSSPKSSIGRLFPKLRLLADYNPCFDEIHYGYAQERPVSLWLLVEPQAFDLVFHPGLVLNQLRFHIGSSKLSDDEVKKLHKEELLVHTRDFYGNLMPITSPVIHDGVQLHLDLIGQHCRGIVALRAKKVASPVDLKNIGTHDLSRYFEILTSRDSILVRPGEYFLLASKEVLNTPPLYNSEVNDHSHIGIGGALHFAGFVDNGFKGDLVFEIRSEELHDILLQDGMPLSRLSFFRTRVKPDKVYGKAIGSNYFGQIGPKASKYFTALSR